MACLSVPPSVKVASNVTASTGTLSASQPSPSFLSCHGGRGDTAVAGLVYFGERLIGGGDTDSYATQ